MSSLRLRLLLSTTLAVGAVLLCTGWMLHALVERSLLAELDDALLAQAVLLTSAVELEGDELDLEFNELALAPYATPAAGGFFQLWRDGDPAYSSPSLEGERLLPWQGEEGGGEWRTVAGHPVRALSLRFTARQERRGRPAEELYLVVARSPDAMQARLGTFTRLLGGVGVLALILTGLALVIVVHVSFRPLGAVGEQVAAIREDALSARVPLEGVPAELVPVIERLNGLLERLEGAFARERAFSNDVAHELRTPLAGLLATLEVSASQERGAEDYAAAVERGTTLVRQLQSVVERLLQLARLDGGNGLGPLEPLDLTDLALEAWDPFARTANERGLFVDLELGHGLAVLADRELLALVLRNLYENAVDYCDPGGRITVHAERSDRIRLEVRNTGSRLSAADVQQATERFWRGDAARTEAALHCGLGLALVERAVRAQGGSLSLTSEAGGEFAAVIELPCAEAPAQEPVAV